MKKRPMRRRRLTYAEFFEYVKEWAFDSKWNDHAFRVGVQMTIQKAEPYRKERKPKTLKP